MRTNHRKNLKLLALLVPPLALGFYVRGAASWRPRTIAKVKSEVTSVAWSPDGKRLAFGELLGGKRVVVWDVEESRAVHVLPTQQGMPSGVAFSPDGQWLAASDGNPHGGRGETRVWDAQTGRLKRQWNAARGLMGVAWTRDGQSVAAAGLRGVQMWSVATGQSVGRVRTRGFAPLRSVSLSPDGGTIASPSTLGDVHVWNRRKAGQPGYRGEDLGIHGRNAALSPDGKTLAVSYVAWAILYDLAARREVARLHSASSILCEVTFSPDGKTLAGGGWDGAISLWDVAARRRTRVLKGHRHAVEALAFAPDNRTLATGGSDGTVRLWRLR